ncbi:hypothetical protein FHR32_007974 [Streptosporangium album]|uniref:Uncharacterized protein n=1 Tax=Streptosporangium album TaxID=47479 RepID=A0A7W7WEN6_9ACTN|nr:hypothetical protein [Streptosporangium album]MBB4943574.1 hypothetical protein [Streptosporangium album]
MYTIDLAYVGRGLHEELVAYIADQQGYYADEGVHVALRDGCSWDEERLRHGATIGLGRALLSRLADGIPWVALNVNTHRPLFWFLARPGLTSLIHPDPLCQTSASPAQRARGLGVVQGGRRPRSDHRRGRVGPGQVVRVGPFQAVITIQPLLHRSHRPVGLVHHGPGTTTIRRLDSKWIGHAPRSRSSKNTR